MILTYFNDSHLRASRPSCRKDAKYYEHQVDKLVEALRVERDARPIRLHGGDLFHVFNSPLSLLTDTMPHFKETEAVEDMCRIMVNAGNHDFFGANTESLRRSGIGLMNEAEALSLIPAGVMSFGQVRVKSAPFMLSYPEDFYWIENKRPGEVWIVMAHDMLTTRPVPFPHREIKSIRTNADVVFCSHWHSQFLEKVGNTWFINSGPLDVQEVGQRHIKPAVAVLDVDERSGLVKPRFQFLRTTGYEEVEVTEEQEKDLGLADDFIREVQNSGLADGGDLSAAVHLVARESGYTQACVERVLARLKEAQVCVEVA